MKKKKENSLSIHKKIPKDIPFFNLVAEMSGQKEMLDPLFIRKFVVN